MSDSIDTSVCHDNGDLATSNSESSLNEILSNSLDNTTSNDNSGDDDLTTTNAELSQKQNFPFFTLPAEMRDITYTALLSLTHPSDTLPFTTDIQDLRGCIGINIPPARLLCRKFQEELCSVHKATHGPRFPRRMALDLAIENPLGWISVYQKLAWEQEVRFEGVPSRYLSSVEDMFLECELDPHIHYDERYSDSKKEELLDEWMASLVDWLGEILVGADSLRKLEFNITVGSVDELEAMERQMKVLMGWREVQRVSVVWEWRHGMRFWSQCDHEREFLREVVATREAMGWRVERRVE